jgi:hypothetical protein
MSGCRIGIVASAALALAACASTAENTSPSQCARGEPMVETQLFFGLSKPNGGVVSTQQWAQFVVDEVTPRFPEGFSIIDTAGFWRDGATQRTISEQGKVVVHLHPRGSLADAAIKDIIAAYKIRFAQEAVLRIDRAVCATF